ncbi:YciI family protein [Thalassoglobus sp. JC818]|uniref:YciI family protein n=1 Tax=Thalassoglobus sp. JC818 TaxID=3232136 RepID=UPI0034588118
MKFVCFGCIDESKLEAFSESEMQKMIDDCVSYDAELRRGGHYLAGEALKSPKEAVTLRPKNGTVDVVDGPFAESKEMIGGLLFLEARDLNHAIALMSKHPGVKHGPFEIRPIDEEFNAIIESKVLAITGSD